MISDSEDDDIGPSPKKKHAAPVGSDNEDEENIEDERRPQDDQQGSDSDEGT